MKKLSLIILFCLGLPLSLQARDGYSTMKYIVVFDFNDTVINELAQVALEEAVKFIKDNDVESIYLKAYTDNIGLLKYRKTIAWKRSNVVRDYFIKEGIKESLIRVIRPSTDDFVTNNRTEDNRATNRQVFIEISYYKKKVIEEPFGLQENLYEKQFKDK